VDRLDRESRGTTRRRAPREAHRQRGLREVVYQGRRGMHETPHERRVENLRTNYSKPRRDPRALNARSRNKTKATNPTTTAVKAKATLNSPLGIVSPAAAIAAPTTMHPRPLANSRIGEPPSCRKLERVWSLARSTPLALTGEVSKKHYQNQKARGLVVLNVDAIKERRDPAQDSSDRNEPHATHLTGTFLSNPFR
jgi:hypothetical protein